MILTIDIGNTSAKYAVMNKEGEMLHFYRLSTDWENAFSEITKEYGKISKVFISNVAGPQAGLEAALAKRNLKGDWLTWDCDTAKKWLSNIPEGFGADRVAADIGAIAAAPKSNLLVVDCGTCITYDVLDSNHKVLGGSISAGVALRLKAMHDYTAALPLLKPEGFAPVVGTEIEGAMRGVTVNGVRWEIEGYAREMLVQTPDIKLFRTGGVPLVFSPEIEKFTIHDPYLVLKGLWHAFNS